MALRRRGNTWTITVEMGFDPATGKRERNYHRFVGSKKEAIAEQAKLLRQRDEGSYTPPNKITVHAYLADWLKRKEGLVTARTLEGYKHIVENHVGPSLGSMPLAKLRPMHIQNYLDAKRAASPELGKGGLSETTLRNHYAVLRKALRDAVSLQMLSVNPALAIAAPRWKRKESPVLDEAQTVQLLEYARGWKYYLPVYLDAYTGVRRGELLGFKWEDVDWSAKTIRVVRSLQKTKAGFVYGPPKSERSRRGIALPDSVMAALKEHRKEQLERKLQMGSEYKDEDLICCEVDGSPIGPNAFSAAFRAFQDTAAEKLGLPRIRFHDLRHGHCSHLLHLNQPLKLVSERLGHSSIAITADLYGHILEGQDREAVNLLDAALAGVKNGSASTPESAVS